MNKIITILTIICLALSACNNNAKVSDVKIDDVSAEADSSANTIATPSNENVNNADSADSKEISADSADDEITLTLARYKEIFDSLASNFVPKDTSLYADIHEKNYSSDSSVIIRPIRKISPFISVKEVENKRFLYYEFKTNVNHENIIGDIILGYLLYEKRDGQYKFIRENYNLLSGFTAATIKYSSSKDNLLILKFDWSCSCEDEYLLRSGSYDLVAGEMKSVSSEENGDSESYHLTENGDIVFSHSYYKRISQTETTKKDTTGYIFIIKEPSGDVKYIYEDGKDAGCPLCFGELGPCC
jgi:hypothetical protein